MVQAYDLASQCLVHVADAIDDDVQIRRSKVIEQVELTSFAHVIKRTDDVLFTSVLDRHTDVLVHVKTNQALGGTLGALFEHHHTNWEPRLLYMVH